MLEPTSRQSHVFFFFKSLNLIGYFFDVPFLAIGPLISGRQRNANGWSGGDRQLKGCGGNQQNRDPVHITVAGIFLNQFKDLDGWDLRAFDGVIVPLDHGPVKEKWAHQLSGNTVSMD